MDLNHNSLNVCKKRIISCYNDKNNVPTVDKLVIDITESESLAAYKEQYDSLAANFLFHCLHGSSLRDKVSAIKNCASLLSSDGVFIGSTILGKDMLDDADRAGETSLGVLKNYNEWGIFGNLGDSFEDLQQILNESFQYVDLKKIGYCGVWSARHPK